MAPGAFVYIADAALVTQKNLEALGDNLFITRLPFTYGEAERVVREAVKGGAWAAVEQEAPAAGHRKKAAYRVCEGAVTIEERSYRAIVVHSDAGDKRRQKRLDRALAASREQAAETLKAAGKTEYFCREDAEAAAEKLRGEASPYHSCGCAVEEKPTYARGRPPKTGERRVAKIRYVLEGRVLERADEVARVREAAGCFVLLTNVPTEGELAHTPCEVLAAYKEQHGIERKRDARAPEVNRLHHLRLGQETNHQAHHLHDDHQVQGGAGGQDRRALALHRAAHRGAAAVRAGFGT